MYGTIDIGKKRIYCVRPKTRKDTKKTIDIGTDGSKKFFGLVLMCELSSLSHQHNSRSSL
jgi:hypothetical protein